MVIMVDKCYPLPDDSRSHGSGLVKVEMYSGPEIHGFSSVGSQYSNCPVPRYFPGNLQKPETRLIFAMAKMSPLESQRLAVEVV